MKKYLFGVFAIALAIGFSAFKAVVVDELSVIPETLTVLNVGSSDSYSESSISCPVATTDPCRLDLTELGITSKAAFMTYINNASAFPTPAAKIAEVNRLAVAWKTN